jgi:arylsulfatase A-like enzyme
VAEQVAAHVIVVPRLVSPNVVLMLADDMGYGDFGCFNHGASETPTLDQLVAEGTCLTQHYSASPVCAPARASLLTGRYPHRTGAIDTLEHRGLDRIALRERTLGDVMRAAGYVTGLVGKWHNGALDDRFHPNQRGFDEFAGFSGGWSRYWDWTLDRNGSHTASDGRYLTDVFTDEAIAFIRRHRHQKFFLYLAYSAPHYPFEAPDDDEAPFREAGGFTNAVSAIYGMIRCMDRGIAAVLEELDDDTLVLFSSDNGPQFSGAGDYSTERFNCGFRGAKGLVYEGGVRLPMVMRWPGGLPGDGRQIDALVHFTDWLPTLAAVAGSAAPNGLPLDGVNVLPLLQGDPVEVPDVRYWQWNRYTPVAQSNAAMRDGRWKLVRPAIDATMQVSREDLVIDIDIKTRPEAYSDIIRDPEPDREPAAVPSAQLFDIDADPGEDHDLAGDQPGRVARMEAELATWFESVERDRQTISD